MNETPEVKVIWTFTKSCCGSKSAVCQTTQPIKKSGVNVFRDAGWFVPDNYYNIGIFYAKKDNLIATAAFGAVQIHVRCEGADCPNLMKSFEELILKATSE